MKEIIAIIRPNKVTATKKALDRMGFPGMSVIPVFGRGKQKGIAEEVSVEISPIVRGMGMLQGHDVRPQAAAFHCGSRQPAGQGREHYHQDQPDGRYWRWQNHCLSG